MGGHRANPFCGTYGYFQELHNIVCVADNIYNQGCCLTGARLPGVPKLRVRATKFLFKETGWAPKHRFSILI